MNNHISKTFDDGYKYRFSVIIPVYNVEDYLEETILSVINQTMDFKSNIQLILINDGSTDSSGAICDKYAEQDSRIRVIHKQNEGLAEARSEAFRITRQAKEDVERIAKIILEAL